MPSHSHLPNVVADLRRARCLSSPGLAPMPSYLDDVPQGEPDAILGIAQAFRESTQSGKVNLVIGAYRDDKGNPYVLPSVAEAEKRCQTRGEYKEYAPIDGLADFTKHALAFAYGESCAALSEGRIAGVQTLSGTGACRIAGEFYARFLPKGTAIHVSDPTWGNHIPIMQLSGLEVKRYKYLNRATNGLDLAGFLADIEGAASGSIFLLHACAHNPTGVDPTQAQWDAISQAILAKGHHVLMDCAYQVRATAQSYPTSCCYLPFTSLSTPSLTSLSHSSLSHLHPTPRTFRTGLRLR